MQSTEWGLQYDIKHSLYSRNLVLLASEDFITTILCSDLFLSGLLFSNEGSTSQTPGAPHTILLTYFLQCVTKKWTFLILMQSQLFFFCLGNISKWCTLLFPRAHDIMFLARAACSYSNILKPSKSFSALLPYYPSLRILCFIYLFLKTALSHFCKLLCQS